MPLAVIETPSGEIRLLPGLEYGSKLEIFSAISEWLGKKKKQEKAARLFSRTANHIEAFE